jgi:AcrR family transcriptional regulator
MAPAIARPPDAEATPHTRRSRVVVGALGQHARLVAAMGELVAEVGPAAIGVHHVCQRAGISRRTFYGHFEDRDACFLEALREASGRLLAHVEEAVGAAGPEWEARAVAATRALIGALDADRVLAQLCVVSALGGGHDAVALRRDALDRIVALLHDAPAPAAPAELVLAGALGGVWDLVHRRLSDEPEASLADLAEDATYLMLAPFVGRRQAAARGIGRSAVNTYVTRWTPAVAAGPDEPGLMVTELTGQTLQFLDGHPGAANVDIARAVDVRHESQMSRHLGRLERAGMVSHRREGRANAWQLTARGKEAVRALPDLRSDAPRLTDRLSVSFKEMSR